MQVTQSELGFLRSLRTKKGRQREQKFVLEGWRALKDALNSPAKLAFVAVLDRYRHDPDYAGFFKECERRRVPIKAIGERDLGRVSDTIHSQGVLAVVASSSITLQEVTRKARIIVAADAVGDPGNIGSIIRSADWFAADAVVLGKDSVELHNEKVVRSTVGSLFHVPVAEGVDLPSAMSQWKASGFRVSVLSADGDEHLEEAEFEDKEVIVVGNEAHGVSKDVRREGSRLLSIRRHGQAESLNSGVACAIALFRLRSQVISGKPARREQTL